MSDDPAFDAWIDRGRKITVRAELERRGLWKARMLGDTGVPCPGCGGRDRFAVNLRKNVFFCRQSGAGGDAIALSRHIDGTTFVQAVETVTGEQPPGRGASETESERAARIARLEREQVEREHKARKAAEDGEKYRELERKVAHGMWLNGKPIRGTLAEAYLAKRKLIAPPEARLRYAPAVHLYVGGLEYDTREKHVRPIYSGPCLLAAIQAADGRFIGVQRTWIDLNEDDGKLRLADPKTGELVAAKKTRGLKKGGTIRLAGHPILPATASGATDFFLGEGTETVLSAYAVMTPEERGRAEFHAGVDLGNLSGKAAGRLPHPTETKPDARGVARRVFVPDAVPAADDDTPIIGIPASVQRLFLLGDGDSEPFATELALRRSAARFSGAYPHLEIRLAMARPGMDFNTMLREAA